MVALGIHGLDLSIAVNGPRESVLASLRSVAHPTRNTLAILLNFKNGANGVISSVLGLPFSIRFAVFGTKGWVEIRDKAHPQAPEGWLLTKGVHWWPGSRRSNTPRRRSCAPMWRPSLTPPKAARLTR